MSPQLNPRVRQLFEEAIDRPEEARLAFLKAACPGDDETYQAVARLIEAHQPAQSFLQNGAPGMERVGRYLVTRELGRGAMGVVYEAIDPLIRRTVAVKVILLEALADRSEASFLRDRLFREARSAGQLLHPGIVILFDVGQEGDVAFITMERVDGLSLQQTLASGRQFDRAEVLAILRQTAAALDHAHQRSVVHCDVKPGNIILDKSGMAKLTDFGIAKIVSTQHYTRTSLLMGTPSYMSPEQIEGHSLDGRSDQFSLAVVAFQLLTGSMPFQADSIAGMAHAIVYGPQPSVRTTRSELQADIDQVLARALHKQPAERFADCTQFVAALEAAWTAVARANVDNDNAAPVNAPALPFLPPSPPVQRGAGRVPWYLAGALLLVLASAGGYKFLVHAAPHSALSLAPVAPASETDRPTLAAPVVAQFAAEPQSIMSGASATIHWNVMGAIKVMIDPGVGAVEASGSSKVRPATTTAYTIRATGLTGQIITQSLRVVVEPALVESPLVAPPPGAAAFFNNAVAERRGGHIQAALSLFKKAADLGDKRAMVELGNLSADADDGPRNYPEAAHWFRIAADHGSSEGALNLGGLFYFGQGVPKDADRAAYWFGRASDGGNALGKFDLGMLFENGEGVPRDLGKARQLYEDAAKLGHEEARKRLLQLQPGH